MLQYLYKDQVFFRMMKSIRILRQVTHDVLQQGIVWCFPYLDRQNLRLKELK